MSWTSWFSNTMSNIYNFLFPSTTTLNPTNSGMISRGSNTKIDLTFPNTVNYDFLMGLYDNTEAGYKLGGFLCHSVISIPLAFMGFPHFDVEDWKKVKNKKFWEKQFKYYNEKFIYMKKQIQLICHAAGTVLVFPWFDSKSGNVRWLFILPKHVTKIMTDIVTKEVSGLITSIEYEFYDDKDKLCYFTEEKKYTRTQIETRRKGILPSGVNASEIRRNPTGILPVIFTNERKPDEFEGHSELERILPLIKAYAQVSQVAHENVLNIKPKQIQSVNDYEAWKAANGITDTSTFSIENKDLILNKAPDEKTEVIVPQHVVTNFTDILKLDFWGIIEGSGIPEICFGMQMVGNAASPEVQIKVLLAYTGQKQDQVDTPYVQLVTATMGLIAMAYNQTLPEEIVNVWNCLDSLTDVERSTIFKNYGDTLQKLIDSNAVSLEFVHKLLLSLTEELVEPNFEKFKKQLQEFSSLRSYLDQAYDARNDFTKPGEDDNDKTGDTDIDD